MYKIHMKVFQKIMVMMYRVISTVSIVKIHMKC